MFYFMNTKQFIFMFFLVATLACKPTSTKQESPTFETAHNQSLSQLDLLIADAYKEDKIPRTVNKEGETHYTPDRFDWTEGFFPGSIWYAYMHSKNKKYKTDAQFFQNKFKEHRFLTTNHDLGFVFNNSFGAAYKQTGNNEFKQVVIDAGNSLIQRFNPNVGCIKSWDIDRGWQSKRGWKFPVIIDNMMNLEMLFELTEITGDTKYREIAIQHANTTLKNHFRDDNSSFHVVDYDPETGDVRSKETAQGYSHESAWARGQAWGLYGFTICYRYTKDSRYLKQAEKIAEFYLNNPNLPSDLVPYWDFDAPKKPNEPRDVSAAAIVASALIELDEYSTNNYVLPAKKIIKNLSSEKYLAKKGSNNLFILKHSVGSIPHDNEIDVPLNYADYYYLESLIRIQEINKNKTLQALL